MAIFSRRIVQKMLNENSSFMSDDQLVNVTSLLNRNDLQSFAAEWETAVLNAFSKLGKVEHEKDLGGASRIDLLFTPHGDPASTFIADVRTVSDDGFEVETPVNDFYIELSKRTRVVTTGGFNLRIGSDRPTEPGGLAKILLPPRDQFASQIFNNKFKAFLRRISENPDTSHVYEVRSATTSVYLSYHPGRRVSSGGWPEYRVAQEKDKNPIFSALKSKYQQLKKSGYSGIKGIILCDGGTSMFRARANSSFEFFYSAEDAIKEFLRRHSSVDFVLLISSIWTNKSSPFDEAQTRQVRVKIIGNKGFENLPPSVLLSLQVLESHFPEPTNAASGARDTIKLGYDAKAFRPLASGIQVSASEIRVSSSTVFALLAGFITQDEFEKALGFQASERLPQPMRNCFAYMLDRKMRIGEITFKEMPHDDSWMIFQFEGPDPALSDFVCPTSAMHLSD